MVVRGRYFVVETLCEFLTQSQIELLVYGPFRDSNRVAVHEEAHVISSNRDSPVAWSKEKSHRRSLARFTQG